MLREAEVTVPAGAHSVLLAVPDGTFLDAPNVTATGDGLRIGSPSVAPGHPLAEGALDLAEQAAARARVDQIDEQIEEQRQRIAAAEGAVRAADLQRRYLEGIASGGDGGLPVPGGNGDLAGLLAMLGSEMVRVSDAVQTAQQTRAELLEAMEALTEDLAEAQAALAALLPFGPTATVVRVPVRAEAAQTVTLSLVHGSRGANWDPRHTAQLDTGAETVTLERAVELTQVSREVWRDVAVSVSTADPDRAREPVFVSSRPARIAEPQQPLTRTISGLMDRDVMAESAPAPVMVAPEPFAVVSVGYSVEYAFDAPVTLAPGETRTLPLTPLEMPADLTNLANPRNDETAFLVATVENTGGEVILPAPTRFLRDGELVGEDFMDLLAANATADWAFGPLDHLPLDWRDLSQEEGDQGIFTRSDTMQRHLEFGVENLSDSPETVRLLYAVPFAEQEDLDLDLSLAPGPDERDVDGRRGVHSWEFTLAPGASRTVSLEVEFAWPEGQILIWRP